MNKAIFDSGWRWIAAVFMLIGFAFWGEARAGKLILVEDRVSRAPIILFAGAPPMTRRAAEELAQYIGKISGARPAVVEGRPDPLPEKAIWVGYQPVLEDLFPGLDFEFENPEEILIASNENHVVIVGRDRWNPDHMELPARHGETIVGQQLEYGTVNAVYTFLQDHLGVRWLWPGESGEDIQKTETIALAPFTYRYHPQFRYRHEVFYFSSLFHGRTGPARDWARRQRLQFDSLYMRASGHGFTDWWDRFHETNPEYFALQPDGTRSGWPRPSAAKICKSNPAVAERWLADVEEQLARNPNQIVFNAASNDASWAGRCTCAACRAWDHPDGEMREFLWQGHREHRVALSDREVTFANRLARLLKERYPEKGYYVMIHSYGLSRPAPVAAVPDDDVIISIVTSFFGRPEAVDAASPNATPLREQFKDWAAVSKNIIWRPNLDDHTGAWRGLPDVGFRQAVEDYRFVAEQGSIGVFSALQDHWATQGPLYYLLGQLAWNPYQDGQAILDDYYERAFGSAAHEVAGYWSLMEEMRNVLSSRDEATFPTIYDAYGQDFFDTAYGYLDRAAALLAGEPEIFSRRLKFVLAGLDYTRFIVDSHEMMKRVWASQGEDTEAADRARSNWTEIEKIHERYPYAIRKHWVQPAGRRMQGLHPDY